MTNISHYDQNYRLLSNTELIQYAAKVVAAKV